MSCTLKGGENKKPHPFGVAAPSVPDLPITDDDRLTRAKNQFVDILSRDVVVYHVFAAPPFSSFNFSIEQECKKNKGQIVKDA